MNSAAKKISDVRAAVIDHIARPRLTEAARLIGAYSAMTRVLGALRVYATGGTCDRFLRREQDGPREVT